MGPREILCPEKLTINRMELEHGYDKEEFKERIEDAVEALRLAQKP